MKLVPALHLLVVTAGARGELLLTPLRGSSALKSSSCLAAPAPKPLGSLLFHSCVSW